MLLLFAGLSLELRRCRRAIPWTLPVRHRPGFNAGSHRGAGFFVPRGLRTKRCPVGAGLDEVGAALSVCAGEVECTPRLAAGPRLSPGLDQERLGGKIFTS